MRRKTLLTTTLSLLTITSTIAASVPAFAADISQISITGMDNLSRETQLKINDAFKNVSDDVVRLYNAIGGEVNFVDELLDRGMGKQQDLMGLYFLDDSDIQVRADDATENNPNTYIPGSFMHEIGHFIYHKTAPFLSDESKAALQSCYTYWSQYSPECYNEDETFATMYAWDKAGMSDLDESTLAMIREAESICGVLAEHMENGQEVGPGIDITAETAELSAQ